MAINKDTLLKLLEEQEPDISKAVALAGANPSGTMLCFRTRDGGTYVFRKSTGKAERIVHAKHIGLGQVKKITCEKDMFILWDGPNKIVSVGVAE